MQKKLFFQRSMGFFNAPRGDLFQFLRHVTVLLPSSSGWVSTGLHSADTTLDATFLKGKVRGTEYVLAVEGLTRRHCFNN